MIWIKITENIKAPEAFLIEIGGQQTDHKAAHSRHRDRASKRMQGSLSPQGASPACTAPGEAQASQYFRVVLHRELFWGGRWEVAQTGSSLPAPPPQESLGRYGDFWILGRDLQKCGLRTTTASSGLTRGAGGGKWPWFLHQLKFLFESEP